MTKTTIACPLFNKKKLLSLRSNNTKELQRKLELFIEIASEYSQEYAGKLIRDIHNLNQEYHDVVEEAYDVIRSKQGNTS